MFYIRDITSDLQTKKQDIYYYAKDRIYKDPITTGGYKNPPTINALKKYCDNFYYNIEVVDTKYKYIMAFEHGTAYFHIVDIYEV